MKWLGVMAAVQLAAAPAAAAALEPVAAGPTRVGAFAGAKLTMTFGGRDHGRMRAGLGIAPLRTGHFVDGRVVTRIGEGLQFGATADGRMALTAGGERVFGHTSAAQDEQARKKGVPTWVYVAGGVVLVLGAAFLAYWQIGDAASE